MKPRMPPLLIVLLLSAAAAPPEAPSVLVTTEPAHQGSLPHILTAYGTVQPSADNGSQALSVLRAGQVIRLSVVLGQQVRRGQPLITLSADPAALATFKQAQAALTLAQGERTRTTQMLAQHLATRDQLAQADKAVADAQSSLDSLNRAGGGSADQTLTAPFDGVVSAVTATPGARIAAGAPLITLSRAGRLVVQAGVEPAQRALLAPGQPARIDSLDGGPTTNGTLLSVGGMLDPSSHLLPVLVGTTAQGGVALLAGIPVRVTVQVGEFAGWLVPRNAVMTDIKGSYLFQVNGTAAVRVDVRLVGTDGGASVVDGPLMNARPVVVSGNTQLQDGGKVRDAKP